MAEPVAPQDAAGKGRETGPSRSGLPRGLWWLLPVLATGLLLAWLLSRQDAPVLFSIDGYTMGSTWSARFVAPASTDRAAVQAELEATLAALDRELSGYRADSDLARINNAPVGSWQELPPHLAAVLAFGLQLHRDSGGAFDMTVGPLVQLWGFAAAEPRTDLPAAADIAAAQARVGSDKVELSADGRRLRRLADVRLDVDAIAPGYAADVLGEVLAARGIVHSLVDIGGELRARGRRTDGQPWQLGIEQPQLARGALASVLRVSDVGVATSGDYRDFVDIDGVRYSHTLDPRQGGPVRNGVASATVVAPTALAADGYATVLMVMGPDEGMAWADQRGLGVYLMVRAADGTLAERYNRHIEPLLVR